MSSPNIFKRFEAWNKRFRLHGAISALLSNPKKQARPTAAYYVPGDIMKLQAQQLSLRMDCPLHRHSFDFQPRSGIRCLSPHGCWSFGVTDRLFGGPNRMPPQTSTTSETLQLVEVRELPNVSAQETVGSSQKCHCEKGCWIQNQRLSARKLAS